MKGENTMQDKIRSKYTDWELLAQNGENQVYKCFELIGIYDTFNKLELPEDEFKDFYISCIKEKRYYYRNEGVRTIHRMLDDSYQGYRGTYHISKRSMRQYGKTHKGEPVLVYESSFLVLDLALKYILENKITNDIYYNHIHRAEMKDYFAFQYECLADFICAGGTTRQEYYKNEIEQKLEKLISEL